MGTCICIVACLCYVAGISAISYVILSDCDSCSKRNRSELDNII